MFENTGESRKEKSEAPRQNSNKEIAELQAEIAESIEFDEKEKELLINLLLGRKNFESDVDKIIRAITGQKELDDLQKFVLAPANAFEDAANLIFSVFDLKTWNSLLEFARLLCQSESREELFRIFAKIAELAKNETSTLQKATLVFEFASKFVFTSFGLGMLSKLKGVKAFARTGAKCKVLRETSRLKLQQFSKKTGSPIAASFALATKMEER